MKKKYIKLSFSLLVILVLSSCISIKFDRVYPLSSYCTLKSGYWDEWKRVKDDYQYFYNVQTKYNAQSLEILIYEKDHHPSNYIAKITINKSTGKTHDADWYSYQGTISARDIPIPMQTSIWERDIRPDFDKGNYKTLKCEVRCDKTIQKAIQKNGLVGTINVFYGDGLGNGFTFH
jgi:hypothetical protein